MKLEIDGRSASLEFDHGKANEMGREQLEQLERWSVELVDRSVGALTSFSRRSSRKGTPIFIAGANVTERQHWSQKRVMDHVRYQRDVLSRFRSLPLFHVAVVHGVALGWGTEWLITADYRIATSGASFALPETGLGILPGAGGSSELSALIGLAQAIRLGMTGEKIGSEEAKRIGLVQETVDNLDSGLQRAAELCSSVTRRSPTAVAAFKAAALASIGLGPEERREVEARAYEHCVESGEAAIGREHFATLRQGGEVPWGPMREFKASR